MSSNVFNIVTVKVGNLYPASYVNKMFSMVKRHYKDPFSFYCVTDDPTDLEYGIHVIPPPGDFVGWWNKMALFSPFMPQGRLLYLDLDQVILGDITDLVKAVKTPFGCYADHILWKGVKLGSAMMIFDPAEYRYIWEDFIKSPPPTDLPGGDQIYIGERIPENEITFLDEIYPGEILSYKYNVKGSIPDCMTRIVNFHGKPKPHEIMETVPWIKRHWQ